MAYLLQALIAQLTFFIPFSLKIHPTSIRQQHLLLL